MEFRIEVLSLTPGPRRAEEIDDAVGDAGGVVGRPSGSMALPLASSVLGETEGCLSRFMVSGTQCPEAKNRWSVASVSKPGKQQSGLSRHGNTRNAAIHPVGARCHRCRDVPTAPTPTNQYRGHRTTPHYTCAGSLPPAHHTCAGGTPPGPPAPSLPPTTPRARFSTFGRHAKSNIAFL
jgi:hypothetical protein